jgi:hypothetical protein
LHSAFHFTKLACHVIDVVTARADAKPVAIGN